MTNKEETAAAETPAEAGVESAGPEVSGAQAVANNGETIAAAETQNALVQIDTPTAWRRHDGVYVIKNAPHNPDYETNSKDAALNYIVDRLNEQL